MRITSSDIPQKEDLDLILKLSRLIEGGINSTEEIAKEIDQVTRQANFLLHVGRMLGVVRKVGRVHDLTDKGRLFLRMDRDEARYYLKSLVLETKIIRHLFEVARDENSAILTELDIARILRKRVGLSWTTARRRASTLCAWLKWLSTFEHVKMLDSNRFEIL